MERNVIEILRLLERQVRFVWTEAQELEFNDAKEWLVQNLESVEIPDQAQF